MGTKFRPIALAILAFGFAFAPRSNAGTEMVIDNSAQAPAYSYAPPPPPVYYAPPPVRVVVYPAVRYYVAPVRVYAYHRVFGRARYCAPWR
ncbi:MAG: hypothetical protein DLM52_08295 [Chthoniobacterales bacterium]|nr:MAG: hypothetical protein DLM52_08295 [Chthoniobacterales bacterium]